MPFVCCIWMFFVCLFFPDCQRAKLCGIVRHWRLRLFLLPWNGRRVHQLRQERVLPRGTRLQERQWRQEHSVSKLGHLPQSPSQLFHPRRVSFLLQRNPYVMCFCFSFSFFLAFPFVSLVLLNSFWNSFFFCRPFVCVCVRDEVGNRLVGTCFHGNEAIDLFWTARTFFF